MPASRRFPLVLIGAFLALYLVWGSTYLVIRIGIESWPPLLMAGVRFLIAGSLLYGFLRWRGVPAPSWAQWKAAGAIGILLLSCGNGGVTLAEHAGVASGVAALAVATVPLFTLVFGRFFGHRNTRLEWAGIGLGLAGIGLLNLGSNLQASPLRIKVQGVGNVLLRAGVERIRHRTSLCRKRFMVSCADTSASAPDANDASLRSASKAQASSTSGSASRLAMRRSSRWKRSAGSSFRTSASKTSRLVDMVISDVISLNHP